jgi:hypothetical protein
MTQDTLRTSRWIRGRRSAPTAVESALATTIAGGEPSAYRQVEGWRGGIIRAYSNGLNDETFTLTLYAIHKAQRFDSNSNYQAQSLGTIACTLGTSTAVAGTIANDANMTGTKRWADTMVWTATTYGTAMLTRIGGNIAAFSPADNTIAELMVSDFGACEGIALVCTTYGLTATSALMPIIKLEV